MKYHNYQFSRFRPKMANDLVRLGNKDKDGGYVISRRQVEMSKVLIGLGVNYDWTFEADFKHINSKTDIYCYDFSVGKTVYLKSIVSSLINVVSLSSYTKEIFNKRSPLSVFSKPIFNIGTYFKFGSFFDPVKRNFFFQKGVSDMADGVFITVPEMFANIADFKNLPDNSVFVKMDIEGSEYDIMEDLLEQSSKINGFAIEFHSLKHMWHDFSLLMTQIQQDYEIVHIHGNNSSGYIRDTHIPDLAEITFMKRSLLTPAELSAVNDRKYPIAGLDCPNIPGKKDMELTFK